MATSLRLSMTLSGGASLGAYQAGAAAALALALGHLDGQGVETTVDAIGGASAGSLVGLCAAHCILEGIDPVPVLHRAWVEEVSLPLLRARGRRAPLSFDLMRERIPALLDPMDGDGTAAHRLERRQQHPIVLHVALTGLQGLTYPIRGLRRDRPITAASYADWCRFKLEPGGGLAQIVEPEGSAPLDFVLASASHPGGFAPRLLDRSGDEHGYRSRGIDNFPDSGKLWYADGGLIQSQPLGRVLASARAADRDRRDDGSTRLNLLIDPRSESPIGSEQWSDPELEPTWQTGLARSLAILPAQILYDDLRRIEKDNSRLVWSEQLVEALAPHLGAGAGDALRGILEQIDSDRGELRADEPGRAAERTRDGDPDPATLLGQAIDELAGLVGKERVAVDVISPLLLSEGSRGEAMSLLAGDFLGDFGGFLSHELRASDFGLGYESALCWLPDGLGRCGVAERVVEETVEAVEARRLYEFDDVDRGRAELADLPLKARLELARLALHTARVLASGVVDFRSRLPDPVGDLLQRARKALPSRRK